MKLIRLVGVCLACNWSMVGCANQEVMSQTTETQINVSPSTVDVVSVPEDFQNFIVKGERICGMPSPSASIGDTGPSLSIATPVTGEDSFSGGSVTTSSQNHGSAAYVADEVLYRLCEMGISYQLTKEEMLDYYIKTLTLLVKVATPNDKSAPNSSPSGTSAGNGPVETFSGPVTDGN